MNELKEENLRLKLTLISIIRQFYNYEITQEKANKYNVKYSENDELGEFIQCYFHMFESPGEYAWKSLGLTNIIVSESELDELENKLRYKLLILLTQEKENK